MKPEISVHPPVSLKVPALKKTDRPFFKGRPVFRIPESRYLTISSLRVALKFPALSW